MEESVRLQKYIASCGVLSRRKAEEAIMAGRVILNGVRVSELGVKVKASVDRVEVDGQICSPQKKKIYLLMNKPEKVICTKSDPRHRKTVFDLLPLSYRSLHSVGRLDFMSCGLLLLTDDGDFTYKITHPSHEIEKEYFIRTDKKIDENLLKNFKNGFSINEISYKIKEYKILKSPNEYTFTLTEGRNREIRNLLNTNSIGVKLLQRIRIGRVELANLEPGRFRFLSEAEVDSLLETGVNDYSH